MSETKFKLPTGVRKQKEEDPHDLIVISVPKAGKTEIAADLTKNYGVEALLFCVERGGTDYITGKYINIWEDPDDKDRLLNIDEALTNYVAWRNALLENKGMYEYLILDNMSDLYSLAELGGTYYYMNQVPMGKSFNRDKETKEEYDFKDSRFRYVTTLPDGNGYQYVYKWFNDQMQMFAQISKYRIYLAHVKDTLLKKSNNNEEVKGSEINLTGKLKDIVSRQVATLSKMLVDGNKRYLSFEVDDSSIIAGSRVSRLEGKILISEKTKDGEIKTYWQNIFNNLKDK